VPPNLGEQRALLLLTVRELASAGMETNPHFEADTSRLAAKMTSTLIGDFIAERGFKPHKIIIRNSRSKK